MNLNGFFVLFFVIFHYYILKCNISDKIHDLVIAVVTQGLFGLTIRINREKAGNILQSEFECILFSVYYRRPCWKQLILFNRVMVRIYDINGTVSVYDQLKVKMGELEEGQIKKFLFKDSVVR